MRGQSEMSSGMFMYTLMEDRIPPDHPLRPIKSMADEVQRRISGDPGRRYGRRGKRSIPSERLLKAQLLMGLVFGSLGSAIL